MVVRVTPGTATDITLIFESILVLRHSHLAAADGCIAVGNTIAAEALALALAELNYMPTPNRSPSYSLIIPLFLQKLPLPPKANTETMTSSNTGA